MPIWQLIIVAFLVAAAGIYVGREIWRTVFAKPGCGSCGSCESNKDAQAQQQLVSLDRTYGIRSDPSNRKSASRP